MSGAHRQHLGEIKLDYVDACPAAESVLAGDGAIDILPSACKLDERVRETHIVSSSASHNYAVLRCTRAVPEDEEVEPYYSLMFHRELCATARFHIDWLRSLGEGRSRCCRWHNGALSDVMWSAIHQLSPLLTCLLPYVDEHAGAALGDKFLDIYEVFGDGVPHANSILLGTSQSQLILFGADGSVRNCRSLPGEPDKLCVIASIGQSSGNMK